MYRPGNTVVSPARSSYKACAPAVYKPQALHQASQIQTKAKVPAVAPATVPARRTGTPANPLSVARRLRSSPAMPSTILRKVGFEYEVGIDTQKNISEDPSVEVWGPHDKGDLIMPRTGYNITADITETGSRVEFILTEIDENDPVARQAMINAAIQVREDIIKIMRASDGEWVRASDVEGLNGPENHRFASAQTKYWNKVSGQLQMTGGVHISRLANVVSGRAYDAAQPVYAGAYSSGNQQLWNAARTAVNARFGSWWASERDVLASVITILAQVPLNARGAVPSTQGQFLARTDYSKILLEASTYLNRPIAYLPFLNAVLQTINAFLPPLRHVTHASDVFAAPYTSAGQSLTGLSIGTWIQDMLPVGATQGTDRVTRANFPGTQAQRKELRAFGGFGNQTDPGNKLIFEWRNLTANHPDDLPRIVQRLLDYVRLTHAPTRWERFSGAVSTGASAVSGFVARASQNPYVRAAALVGGAYALYSIAPIMMKPDPSRPRPKPYRFDARIVLE